MNFAYGVTEFASYFRQNIIVKGIKRDIRSIKRENALIFSWMQVHEEA